MYVRGCERASCDAIDRQTIHLLALLSGHGPCNAWLRSFDLLSGRPGSRTLRAKGENKKPQTQGPGRGQRPAPGGP